MTGNRYSHIINAGEESYERWQNELRANPEYQKIYEEEAAKSELWLQLVEARQTAGLTLKQAAKRLNVSLSEVKRIERCGYDFCTLETLRHYLAALIDSQ